MKYLNIFAMVIGYIVIGLFIVLTLIKVIAGIWAASLIIAPIAVIALIIFLITKGNKKK